MNGKMIDISKEKLEAIVNLANAGNAEAQYTTAMLLMYGELLPENEEKAFEYLTKAHLQGYTDATYNLAACYHYGQGTDADTDKAFALYREAADKGHGMGMDLVGKFYYDGLCAEQNYAEAMKWFEKSLASDDTEAVAYAEYLIGNCYKEGRGAEKNEEIAMEWYKKSALHGDFRARRIVGMI